MKLVTLAAGLAAVVASGQICAQGAAPAAASPPDFSKVEIKTTDLGHKTYMLAGQGGNMTVGVGGDSILLIDTEFAPLHDKIKTAIAALSPVSVKYVVNTHFHGDHTGGDAAFAKEGTVVLANENVKKRLAAGTGNALTDAKVAPMTGDALPSRTYTDKLTLDYGQRKAELRHVANAHTDGDTFAYFADANVLSTGDVVTVGGRYPNVDVANGGSIQGMISAVDAMLRISNNDTKYVPGHGPLLARPAVMAYRDLLQKSEDHVASLVKAGKSEEEAVAAHPLADLDSTAGANQQASDNFVKLIYRSLKAK